MIYILNISAVFIEGESHQTYGISLLNNNMEIKTIKDITNKKEKLETLIQKMNEGHLSPVHFEDIIEDELNSII